MKTFAVLTFALVFVYYMAVSVQQVAGSISNDYCPYPTYCEQKPTCHKCNNCCLDYDLYICGDDYCPDIDTDDGFDEMYSAGCFRPNPRGGKCIFYSPCLDNFGNQEDCPLGVSNGYCDECNHCPCSNSIYNFPKKFSGHWTIDWYHPHTCPKAIPDCKADIRLNKDKCCYEYIKGQCRFVCPCPKRDAACEGQMDGMRACHRCSKCECIHELSFCEEDKCCADPIRDGCYAFRSFAGIGACYWVSPCPPDDSIFEQIKRCIACDLNSIVCSDLCIGCPCQDFIIDKSRCYEFTGSGSVACIEPKTDFCYVCNEELDTCEFISPCPKQKCQASDRACEYCNPCVCKGDYNKCEYFGTCAGPSYEASGWTLFKGSCKFVFIPPSSEVFPVDFCQTNIGEEFCRDCNKCKCLLDGTEDCTSFSCRTYTAADIENGHWEPVSDVGGCLFVFPF